MMLLGWGILAVPTGIVTAEIAAERFDVSRLGRHREIACERCGSTGHRAGAGFCHECGAALPR